MLSLSRLKNILVGLGPITSSSIQITVFIQYLSHCSENPNVKFHSEDLETILYITVADTMGTS